MLGSSFQLLFEFLNPLEAHRLGLVSKCWRRASYDSAIWREYFKYFASTQLQISRELLELAVRDPLQAFRTGHVASTKQWLTEEELCGRSFYARSRECVGDGWRERDPWWRGIGTWIVTFQPNHCVLIGAELTTNELTETDLETVAFSGRFEFKWKLANGGTCVKIDRFPSLTISRYRGGYLLMNLWLTVADFPLPPQSDRTSLRALELTDAALDDRLPRPACWLDAMAFKLGRKPHDLDPALLHPLIPSAH